MPVLIMSFENELCPETESQLRCKYRTLQRKLSEFSGPSTDQARNQEIMNLLHEFNDIKDACQTVLGALANLEQCTFREMHLKYNLPLTE